VRILFVTSRFPHPPYRGDQVRAFHQIRLLSARHSITLLSFREGASPGSIRALAGLCREVQVVDLPEWRKALNLARCVVDGRPIQVAFYDSPVMRRLVADRLPHHDVLHAQLVRMAPYVDRGTPAVLDLVDALSTNMESRAVGDHAPMRFITRLEARRLRRYEPEAVGRARRSAVVSDLDRRALGSPAGMAVIPQGVDLSLFPFVEGPRDPDAVVFTGNLGYFVNVDAAAFLARQVWPRIRAARPAATLRLVGDRPSARVRRLASLPGVQVVGRVDNMHTHLARARLAVAPTRAGSGMQNKIIEAMASGTPLVATSGAVAALDARDGEELLVADGAEAFAAAMLRVLGDDALARRLAAAGRRMVESRFTLERSVEALERLYEEAVAGRLEASA
jgi:sugar transferase (PEP-CTERM/EpsH1 system associated)